MNIKNIIQAQRFLYRFTPTGAQQVYSGGKALERPRAFYKLIGNPQNSYKVIHVAGTSGKGSTCYYISHLLHSQGLRVGLSISPHLYDIRERLQVDNKLISEEDFCAFLSDIIPAIELMKDSEFGYPTYFEIMQGLAFYTFQKKKIEYAVMETGLGGRYDPTNTVTREDKIAVITKIGFDHKHILGDTLTKIALEKAKIINQNNFALSIEQKPQVEKVINQVAQEENTLVQYLRKNEHINKLSQTAVGISYDFAYETFRLDKLQIGSFGLFQAENTALALAVIHKLSQRDGFSVDENKIRSTLRALTVDGRMEFKQHKKKTFILDGAHNPQKMQTFIQSLSSLYPGRKLTFIIGIKKTKEVREMMKYVVPIAEKIIITSFLSDKDTQMDKNITKKQALKIQGYPSPAMETQKIAEALESLLFTNYIQTDTLNQAINISLTQTDNPIVITGSLYLIGNTVEIFQH